MGIEPYVIRSGVLAVVCQRLVRASASAPARRTTRTSSLGLPVARARVAVGCDACGGTGYRGRIVLAEMLIPNHPEISHAIRSQADMNQLESDRACEPAW